MVMVVFGKIILFDHFDVWFEAVKRLTSASGIVLSPGSPQSHALLKFKHLSRQMV